MSLGSARIKTVRCWTTRICKTDRCSITKYSVAYVCRQIALKSCAPPAKSYTEHGVLGASDIKPQPSLDLWAKGTLYNVRRIPRQAGSPWHMWLWKDLSEDIKILDEVGKHGAPLRRYSAC